MIFFTIPSIIMSVNDSFLVPFFMKEGDNMQPTDKHYQYYVQILREELVPAMGCTEPIAIAYGAAKAREVLGSVPERVFV